MELLSPAGNLLSAYSAFKGGADAIYIGGKQFSARASAENFTNEEIEEITNFAHSIGKKVYVTLNTLLFQDEFFQAVEFAKFLHEINIDGIIIQDLGLAHYLHKVFPNLPLNASTQLNCHNIRQAEALVKIGFKRIVLARESNLEFVKKVKKLGVEVEVFGHGALCVSYSGNCLLSSFIGDRSGNRGRCAQPCRMQYDLIEDRKTIDKSSFSISTKDLMTLENMQDFIDAGVDSLKIEGRLKSNEYIYSVSKAYRHAIDAAIKNSQNLHLKEEKDDLIKIFNRQFTKGFINNATPFEVLNTQTSSHQGEIIGKVVKANKGRVSIKISKHIHRLDGIRFNTKDQFGLTIEKMFVNKNPVDEANKNETVEIVGIEHCERFLDADVIRTKDYILNKKIESELKNALKVNITGKFSAHIGKPITLEVCFNNNKITVDGSMPEMAKEEGTSEERVIDQLNKTGIYPYKFSKIDLDMDKCFIKVSELNTLRNRALEILQKSFVVKNIVQGINYKNTLNLQGFYEKYSVIVGNFELENEFLNKGFETFTDNKYSYINNNRVTKKETFNCDHELIHFPIINLNGNYIIASQYCNITNSYALDAYFALGFSECILSAELDYVSINSLMKDFKNRHNAYPNAGIVMYGKIDMMIMRSCPIGSYYKNKAIKCNRCHSHDYYLRDRSGEFYRLSGDSECNTRILNNRPIYLLDRLEEMKEMGISSFYMIFTDETKKETNDLLFDLLDNKPNFSYYKHTRGHYQKRPL